MQNLSLYLINWVFLTTKYMSEFCGYAHVCIIFIATSFASDPFLLYLPF